MGTSNILLPLSLLIGIIIIPFACGWGYDGHIAICRIAQARLSKTASLAVRRLLPAHANGDLGLLCPWADRIKMHYPWSADLHFINTPDNLCTYDYTRDCKGRDGVKNKCLAGAINNYTTQLINRHVKTNRYNLTESLLFLSHFIGDIHQPLHVGFTSDKGGNTIRVTWFTRKQVLHHVWDTDLIRTDEGGFNASLLNNFIKKIEQEITENKWRYQVNRWEACSNNQTTCPNIYAAESIKAACDWAYKGVHRGSILKELYFQTRSPVVEMRLAQAGVRLAATLNRIFA
ncbi:hypothetical protein ABFX02_05G033900 [Erythranthe guttata]